jgi:hypothetical protein
VGAFMGICFLPWIYIIPFAFAASASAFLFERSTYLIDEHIIQMAKNDKADIIAKKLKTKSDLSSV